MDLLTAASDTQLPYPHDVLVRFRRR
jgi:hypothetical protein